MRENRNYTTSKGTGMKYRKKPVIIEAKQFTNNTVAEVSEWVGNAGKFYGDSNGQPWGCVHTLEGKIFVAVGDYIVKGVMGEFYPVKPDIFALTYEKVEE